MTTSNGHENLDAFTTAYLVCALWSSTDNSRDDGGDPLDHNYGIEGFSAEAITRAKEDCKAFRRDNADVLSFTRMLAALRVLAVAVAVLCGVGCSAAGDGSHGPSYQGPALAVFVADAELEEPFRAAAERIHDASGLRVEITRDHSHPTATPAFSTDAMVGQWAGWYHGSGEWIAIGSDVAEDHRETIAAHEMIHALGVGHVYARRGEVQPIMHDHPARGAPITERDLERLCAAQDCVWMAPEADGAAPPIGSIL